MSSNKRERLASESAEMRARETRLQRMSSNQHERLASVRASEGSPPLVMHNSVYIIQPNICMCKHIPLSSCHVLDRVSIWALWGCLPPVYHQRRLEHGAMYALGHYPA